MQFIKIWLCYQRKLFNTVNSSFYSFVFTYLSFYFIKKSLFSLQQLKLCFLSFLYSSSTASISRYASYSARVFKTTAIASFKYFRKVFSHSFWFVLYLQLIFQIQTQHLQPHVLHDSSESFILVYAENIISDFYKLSSISIVSQFLFLSLHL